MSNILVSSRIARRGDEILTNAQRLTSGFVNGANTIISELVEFETQLPAAGLDPADEAAIMAERNQAVATIRAQVAGVLSAIDALPTGE